MADTKAISLVFVVIIFQISQFIETTALFVSVQVDNEGVFRTSNSKSVSGPAWSTFKNDMNKTGWAYLEVYTNEKFNDSEQAYAAGMAEGKATREMIVLHWHNTMESYCKQPYTEFCKRLHEYLTENLAWTYSQIKEHAGKDAYWHQVELFLTQMNGMSDGFYGISGKPTYIVKDVFGIMMLNQISGDLEDLESALQNQEASHVLGSGSCSGLIKVLANNSDLYVSQDTWNTYQSMLRILKKYSFKFHNTRDPASGFIVGEEMTFSSYPASLTSGDDFYTISSGLSTLETTIGNGNPKLWAYVTPKNSVFEGIRSMVANRLAQNGEQWSTLFSKFNSGTYNNMWMVVDYKLFHPGKPLVNGLLYVLEQLPGKIVFKDLTSKLKEQGYWASYNTPYFPEIFNMSGQNEMVKKYGDWFTFEHTPRANIFRRDHSKVTDISSMTKLMRYNDYQHDPLSRCNCTPPYSAENAISARCDLNPANGTYPFGALGHRSHGGTDMKLTSSSLFASRQFVAVAGPTFDQQPPFQWSKSDYAKTVAHIGHPDLFKFSPITHKWGSR